MKKIIVNSIFVSIIVVISFVALTRSAEEVKQEKAVVATPHVWSVADSRAYARDKMFELVKLATYEMAKLLDKKKKSGDVVKKDSNEDDESPISKILLRNIESIKKIAEKEGIDLNKLIKHLKEGE